MRKRAGYVSAHAKARGLRSAVSQFWSANTDKVEVKLKGIWVSGKGVGGKCARKRKRKSKRRRKRKRGKRKSRKHPWPCPGRTHWTKRLHSGR